MGPRWGMIRLWVFGGSIRAFPSPQSGWRREFKSKFLAHKHQEGLSEVKCKSVSPLIFPVCLRFCRSRFLRCTLGHRGPSCLCLLHKRERANNRLAQQELIVNSWSWYFPYRKPSPVHTKGLLEAWVVGSMGYMALKAFMFERLVLSFESGNDFQGNHIFVRIRLESLHALNRTSEFQRWTDLSNFIFQGKKGGLGRFSVFLYVPWHPPSAISGFGGVQIQWGFKVWAVKKWK